MPALQQKQRPQNQLEQKIRHHGYPNLRAHMPVPEICRNVPCSSPCYRPVCSTSWASSLQAIKGVGQCQDCPPPRTSARNIESADINLPDFALLTQPYLIDHGPHQRMPT